MRTAASRSQVRCKPAGKIQQELSKPEQGRPEHRRDRNKEMGIIEPSSEESKLFAFFGAGNVPKTFQKLA